MREVAPSSRNAPAERGPKRGGKGEHNRWKSGSKADLVAGDQIKLAKGDESSDIG